MRVYLHTFVEYLPCNFFFISIVMFRIRTLNSLYIRGFLDWGRVSFNLDHKGHSNVVTSPRSSSFLTERVACKRRKEKTSCVLKKIITSVCWNGSWVLNYMWQPFITFILENCKNIHHSSVICWMEHRDRLWKISPTETRYLQSWKRQRQVIFAFPNCCPYSLLNLSTIWMASIARPCSILIAGPFCEIAFLISSTSWSRAISNRICWGTPLVSTHVLLLVDDYLGSKNINNGIVKSRIICHFCRVPKTRMGFYYCLSITWIARILFCVRIHTICTGFGTCYCLIT